MRYRFGVLALMMVALPICASTQSFAEMTIEGVARSASLIKAVKNVCSKIHKLEMDKANQVELAFGELCIKQYGFDAFSKAVLVENDRRYKEVQITGPNQWCENERATLEKIGFGNIYS